MKKILFFILCVLLILIATVVIFLSFGQSQQDQIRQLETAISSLKADVRLADFIITSRENESVSTDVILYDYAGNRICRFTVTLPGTQLYFDVFLVKTGSASSDGYIAFPSRIYSDTVAPVDGILLYDFYTTKDGFPGIFSNSFLAEAVSTEYLTELFQKVRNGSGTDSSSFGSSVHDPVLLSRFLLNRPYSIVYHPQKGGVEVLEAMR